MKHLQQLNPEQLRLRLAERLSLAKPGRLAQRAMAPALAYGRHHGPATATARESAVLAALVPTAEGWRIPVVTRAASLRAHAGQVSLPGGSLEPGESPSEAALREFAEEMGPELPFATIAGELSSIFVFVSGFVIRPIVAVADSPLQFQPSAAEVDRILLVPPESLESPQFRGMHLVQRRGLQFSAPCYLVEEQKIWGATCMILAELAAALDDIARP